MGFTFKKIEVLRQGDRLDSEKRIPREPLGEKIFNRTINFLSGQGSYWEAKREKAVALAIESKNTGKVLKIFRKVDGELKAKCEEYLSDEKTRFSFSNTLKLYRIARIEDGMYVQWCINAYKQLDDSEKQAIWRKVRMDFEGMVMLVESLDGVGERSHNIARIYSAIHEISGEDERNAGEYESICKRLEDIAQKKSGNSIGVRKFALDLLHGLNHQDDEFWGAIININGNGNEEASEIAKYALILVLKTEGKEKLLIQSLPKIAEKIAELSYSECEGLDRKALMKFIAFAVSSKSRNEDKLVMLEALSNSDTVHRATRNKAMEESIAAIIKTGTILNANYFGKLETLKIEREEARIEVKLLKMLVNADTGTELRKAEREVAQKERAIGLLNIENILTETTLRFLYRAQWCPKSVKGDLLELLETRPEMERIAKILMNGRITRDEAERIMGAFFKKMEKMGKMGNFDEYVRLYASVQKMITSEDEKTKAIASLGAKRVLAANEYAQKVMSRGIPEEVLSLKGVTKVSHSLSRFKKRADEEAELVEKLGKLVKELLDSLDIKKNIRGAQILLSLKDFPQVRHIAEELKVLEDLREIAKDGTCGKEKLSEAQVRGINEIIERLEKAFPE